MSVKQLNIFDLNRYPREPGYQMRDTSKRAAFAARGRKKETQNRIVVLLRAKPLTADEIAEYLEEPQLYIRPRVTELAECGVLEDSNVRRLNRTGKSAIVWRVKS
jgi:predicted ArsR family transcriptional regulator